MLHKAGISFGSKNIYVLFLHTFRHTEMLGETTTLAVRAAPLWRIESLISTGWTINISTSRSKAEKSGEGKVKCHDSQQARQRSRWPEQ